MTTVFLGSRQFVFPVIDVLTKESNLTAVLTKPDAPAGRGEKMTPSPVKEYVNSHYPDIAILTPERLDDATYEQLKTYHPDLFIVAAYGLLIPKRFLELPKKGTINIHPSLLPQLRGASPLQTAIVQGDAVTGVTIMQLDEQLDHGPLLWHKEVPIEKTDTFVSLGEKTFGIAADEFPTLLKQIEHDEITPVEQDHEKATFCHHITRDHGYIDLTHLPSKEVIDRMIRAYFPWPSVWTKIVIRDQEVRMKFFPEHMVQLEGKKKMPVKEFLKGYPEQEEILRKIIDF